MRILLKNVRARLVAAAVLLLCLCLPMLLGWQQRPNARLLYVDGQSGSDTLAQRANPDRPFRTLTAAKNAAESGDLIVVEAATYNENKLLKNGVNWYFSIGSTVHSTSSAPGAIFSDGTDAANADVVCTIGGYGRFIRGGAPSAGTNTICSVMRPGSTVNLFGVEFHNQCTNKNETEVFQVDGGTLNVTQTGYGVARSDDYDFFVCYGLLSGGTYGTGTFRFTGYAPHAAEAIIECGLGSAPTVEMDCARLTNEAEGTNALLDLSLDDEAVGRIKLRVRESIVATGGAVLANASAVGVIDITCPFIRSTSGIPFNFGASGSTTELRLHGAHIQAGGTNQTAFAYDTAGSLLLDGCFLNPSGTGAGITGTGTIQSYNSFTRVAKAGTISLASGSVLTTASGVAAPTQ